MPRPPAVLHHADDITPGWLAATLGRPVEAVERDAGGSTWGVQVRLKVRVAGQSEPLRLRVKLASAAVFGRAEVDYYTRYFLDLPAAPLVPCHHAAADATHYHLLLDDLAETHRNQFDVPPTPAYGHALVTAAASLHAHLWPQPPPDADALANTLAPARAGLPALLEAMRDGFTAEERDTVSGLLEGLEPALRARLGDPVGFTWLHGDLNPGNVLAPIAGEGPLYLIDHQPFGGTSLTGGLAAYDLAYALATWWPVAARRALERPLVARWHSELVARGVTGYSAEQAWRDWRLAVRHCVCVPAARCGEPGGVTDFRWVWEPQLRRLLAAVSDSD